MKVVFLCGGIGKRMSPLQGDKSLFKFLGKTLLEYQIEKSLAAGLNEFIFIGNPGNIDKLRTITDHFPQSNFQFAVQKEPTGMAGALQSISPIIGEEMIIISPDDIFDESVYVNMLGAKQENNASAYILGTRVKQYFSGGYLLVDENGYMTRIMEKPGPGREPSNLVTIVVHLYHDTEAFFINLARAGHRHDAYEQILNKMIKQGHRLKVVTYQGVWQTINYPWDILDVSGYFLEHGKSHIAPSAVISEKATLEGKIIIGDNTRIMENVVIHGPCYIGRNSVIGNNVLIRDRVHIGDDCVVGFGTEIKHSYIGDGSWFHTNYIGDSVIAEDCSFGAGAITANLRNDENRITVNVNGIAVDSGQEKLGVIVGANTKIGVNASLMPGICIGPNTTIGPQVMLRNNVGRDTTVRLKSTLKISKGKSPVKLRKSK